MPFDIIPRAFWNNQGKIPSIFDEDDWSSFLPSSGLTISEDDNHVFIEAAVPGLSPENVEITFEKGVLWIRGNEQQKEEDKTKKYYRKASSSYSYRVAVPGEIDESQEPKATCKNGVMKVAFQKKAKVEPKRIKIEME